MAAYTISVESRTRSTGLLSPRATVVLICVSYVAAFVLVYNWVIVRVWAYEGFRSVATPQHAVIAWILAALPSFWIPIQLKRPSVLVYWLLYILVIVPACLVPIYSLVNQTNGPLWMAASIVVLFGLAAIVYRVPLLRIPRVHLQNHEFAVILAVISAVSYSLLVLTFGINVKFVSLQDIYIVRAEFQQMLEQSSALVAYAIDWQAYVINPVLLAVGLTSRRSSWVLAGMAGQIAIYSISGFRVVLFSGLFLAYVFWLMRDSQRFAARISGTWAAMFTLAGGLEFFGHSQFLVGLLGERLTGIPGLLTGYYYDFFSSHPKAHLGYSILKSIVDYPYAVEPRRIIGYLYFHNLTMSANANLWADAYANFGYSGMICITLLLAVVLWFYDSISAGCDLRAAALIIALPALALSNASLLTSLLTNGILVAMLLVYLMPPKPSDAVHGGRAGYRNPLSKQSPAIGIRSAHFELAYTSWFQRTTSE